MSNYPPQPLRITRVVSHSRFKNIITITDESGQDWHYLQNDNGELILGFPFVTWEKKGEHAVHFFNPAGPHGMPILLEVECTLRDSHE